MADVSQRLLSFDCFLNSAYQINKLRIAYSYLLIYLLLPIILVLITFVFWKIKARLRGWAWASSRATTSIIVLFFLVHPSVTRQVFAIFNCRDIDGDARLIIDLEVVCYAGPHLAWAIAGGGLGLLLWVGGIPFAAFAVLRDKRPQLGNDDVR